MFLHTVEQGLHFMLYMAALLVLIEENRAIDAIHVSGIENYTRTMSRPASSKPASSCTRRRRTTARASAATASPVSCPGCGTRSPGTPNLRRTTG